MPFNLNLFQPPMRSPDPEFKPKESFLQKIGGWFKKKFEPEKLLSPLPPEGAEFERRPTAEPSIPPKTFFKPTEAPTPTPTVQPDFFKTPKAGKRFNFTPFLPEGEKEPTQPPSKIGELIRKYFSDDADRAAAVAYTENRGYNSRATHENPDGGFDYGIFQINSKTFEDMMKKHPYRGRLMGAGIIKLDDLLEEDKNVFAASVVRQYEEDSGARPWSWWYGHRDSGYKGF